MFPSRSAVVTVEGRSTPVTGYATYGGTITIPISIISDSRLVCEGLPALLKSHLSLGLVACYPSEPVVSAPVDNPFGHVVLIDSGMGPNLALAWTRFWHEQPVPAYVLVLELANDVSTILACIEAGACGYTLKTAAPEEIAEAIVLAHRGGAKCSPQVTAHLFARLTALNALHLKTVLPDIPLTPREFQVLRLIAQGYSNREIALELVITPRTVKYHVHNILTKLGGDSRRAAVQMASQRGWLESNTARLYI